MEELADAIRFEAERAFTVSAQDAIRNEERDALRRLPRLLFLICSSALELDEAGRDAAIEGIFERFGIKIGDGFDLSVPADRLRRLPDPGLEDVIVALDRWGLARSRCPRVGDGDWRDPLRLAALLDDDVSRGQARDAWIDLDLAELEALIRPSRFLGAPPAAKRLMALAAAQLKGEPETAVRLLNQAQAQHPQDFAIALELAVFGEQSISNRDHGQGQGDDKGNAWSFGSAIGFARVARALRPESAPLLERLLRRQGREREAMEAARSLPEPWSADLAEARAIARSRARGSRPSF